MTIYWDGVLASFFKTILCRADTNGLIVFETYEEIQTLTQYDFYNKWSAVPIELLKIDGRIVFDIKYVSATIRIIAIAGASGHSLLTVKRHYS